MLAFDDYQGDFKSYLFEIDIEGCFEKTCSFDVDEHLIIFNGTALICDESSNVGIVTKSKYEVQYKPYTVKGANIVQHGP